MSDGQEKGTQEIPLVTQQLAPMSPAIAFKTLMAVARSVTVPADMHDLIQQALHVIRARLVRADELEAQQAPATEQPAPDSN